MLRQHDRLADRVLRGHISLPGAGDSTIFKHPHRRVRPFGTKDRRHDRVICVRAHEALLVLGARQALDARKQPGADADSLGTEHERGRGRPAIRDSTCRDNRRSVHRIYYRRYKRHRAEIGLHVPACFLRLNNNCICAERLEPPRALHRVSRSPYFDPGAFSASSSNAPPVDSRRRPRAGRASLWRPRHGLPSLQDRSQSLRR
jgi:hypothetical protein